ARGGAGGVGQLMAQTRICDSRSLYDIRDKNAFDSTAKTMTSMKPTIYRRYGKRLFDLALTLPLLILLAPVLVVAAIVVRLGLGRGILFKQSRPGLHGKPFVLYKFRTMVDAYDGDGKLLPDE